MTGFWTSLAAALVSCAALAPALAADPAGAPPPVPDTPSPFFLFADTQVSYHYQFPAAEPGVRVRNADGSFRSRGIPKQIFTLSHANAWAYGTNLLSLDILKSGSQERAGTTNAPGGFLLRDDGATEVYGLYRGTLSLNALTGTKAFIVPGLVKDVSLSYGFDANTKDTAFGPRKRNVVGGLNLAFDVPAGFLSASVHAYKEWNRNGFNPYPNRDISYDTVPEIEIAYSFPLAFTGLPLSVTGINNIVLPKGRGVRNPAIFAFNRETGLEFVSRTNLVLDLGKLVYDRPDRVDVFIGFQYWLNKFGNLETATLKGTEEKSFLAGVAFHVF
ncbi:hypothetical protein [Methylobacterium sp. Leaf93]|uniref:hypothetical protein n=1 Tax=Methylobacterium sp. Leaf93 TaxID=1736249 RepID=UPI000A3E17EE|nr:hypothetical protein [Methylobacterium sp. Leaf93]